MTLTDILEKLSEYKTNYSDTIIFFGIGDFYVTYGDDAVELSNMLGIILTKRDEVKQAGFPKHQLDSFLLQLVRAGRRVAIR